ncbi:MAG: DUF488 domain-containing protein [Gemmatimonadota bacterium]
MEIRLKRIYEEPSQDDGARVLVERLWPRGVSRERAALEAWPKDVAPSHELRRWYGHDPERWPEFRERYRRELRGRGEPVSVLRRIVERGRTTFVYAARDERRNSAVVLKEYLEEIDR